MNSYKIQNLENQNKSVGSIEQPYFFKITAGVHHLKSLNFHAQIEEKYHVYRINQVNKETLNLHCRLANCPAKATARIPTLTSMT